MEQISKINKKNLQDLVREANFSANLIQPFTKVETNLH